MEPKIIPGARAPLFDRLVDPSSRSAQGRPFATVLDRDALKESVRTELSRLLNTRSAIPVHSAQEPQTAIDYGIPDFSSLSPSSTEDQNRIAQCVSRAIQTFEPRLKQV